MHKRRVFLVQTCLGGAVLLARPSFARAINEARPYRNYFPLGAPDRD